MEQVFELLDKKGAFYFHKQMHFLKLIDGDTEEGDYRWSFSMEEGLLVIDTGSGKHYELEVEILGSIHDETETFMWAWANKQLNIPIHLTNHSRNMKTYGNIHGIEPFKTEIFELDEVINPHFVALLSSVLCEAKTYFIGQHNGGAVVFLIKDKNFPEIDTIHISKDILFNFANYISNFFVENHLDSFIHYVETFGLKYNVEKGKFFSKAKTIINVIVDGEEKIEAKFDKHNRLVGFQMKLDESDM